ncbi:hypothetical protein [Ilumatobacter sp.]|uniref:hypothetical protein n=1 Tax=Ilumatobacter sp. TaxID=1967498 RepID=UPI003B529B63
MSDMDHDRTDDVEDRLRDASDRLVASFADLDSDAEARAVRRGARSGGIVPPDRRRSRWLTAAAVVALLAGGIAALAGGLATRSDGGEDDLRSATVVSTSDETEDASPETTPASSTAPELTDPPPATSIAAPDTSAPSTSPPSTAPAPPARPETTPPSTDQPDPSGPPTAAAGELFVTVTGESRAVIDVRDPGGVVASFDLTCATDVDCVVRSARVMGDTIWAAIADTEPGDEGAVVRSRIVSVTWSNGEVTEHLSLDGPDAVRSAGRGADGVLYAHVDSLRGDDRPSLVEVDDGAARVVETGVAGFRLSDDGRFLAVSFSNPSAGAPTRFEVEDLVDGTTAATFELAYVNAGPAAWSPDGRFLIVDEQWEDGTAWAIDPWSGSGEPVGGTQRFLDGACFLRADVVAHRTWDVGYGQGDARPGVIRLTSLTDGSTVGELGDGLFGDGLRCHPDGSVSYLRRPVVEVGQSEDVTQSEPDRSAPVDLVRIAPDGTTTVTASGDLRLV